MEGSNRVGGGPRARREQGIPRKNLCKVGGLSLIAHVARTTRALDWIDRAVLTTDDQEMAEEGRQHGLEVPFMRPDELATDSAGPNEMWRHAWSESEKHFGCEFDVSLLLQPTTPLRRPEEVERTVASLVEGDHAAATTVCAVPADFLPQRILRLGGGGPVSEPLRCHSAHRRRPSGRRAARRTLVARCRAGLGRSLAERLRASFPRRVSRRRLPALALPRSSTVGVPRERRPTRDGRAPAWHRRVAHREAPRWE